MVDPWRVLGIAATGDAKLIKKAYAARLKRAHPEDDPEAFQQLRQAYEMALAFARWQKASKEAPQTPKPESEQPPAPRIEPHPSSPPALRPVDSTWKPDNAAALLVRAEQLHDDPEQRASRSAWKTLLADESLWNVDVRSQFERGLLVLFLRRGCVFTAVVGCLVEQEFHWTEQALLLRRTFPSPVVERLIERLEQAPFELADELIRDGHYREARNLVEPIAQGTGFRPRVVAAQRLLARCIHCEAAERLLEEVEQLRLNSRAWASVEDWRRLLDHPDLRSSDVRSAFHLRLATFLGAHGDALSGEIWRLLRRRYQWPMTLPEDVLARALPALGAAIVEDIEALCDEGKYREVAMEWAHVILRLEGDAAPRGRLALERCCLQALERAEAFATQAFHREVIDELAPYAAVVPGKTGARARALFERSTGAILDAARLLYEGRRFSDAIARIGPIVRRLQGETGVKARLLLARCYSGNDAHGRAAHYLKEVLHDEPRNLEAHLLLAAACRARGLPDKAAEHYRKVLALRPGHPEAARDLPIVEREAQQLRAAQQAARQDQPKPARRDEKSHAVDGAGTPWALIWVLYAVLSVVRSCSDGTAKSLDPKLIVGAFLALVVVGALALTIHRWPRQSADAADEKGGLREIAIGIVGSFAAIALLVLVFVRHEAPAPTRAPVVTSKLERGFAELEAGNAAKALPLLQAAAAENSRAKDVYEGLGRALNGLGRTDDAMAAFTRQIDAAPRHERAYAWRAHLNMNRGRWDDAEKDLLKQIEVAPSVPWSYEQLARHRMSERRYAEAEDLFARCTQIEPSQAGRWLDLGSAQLFAAQKAGATVSLDKAMGLAPEDWMRVQAAALYRRLGFTDKAGEAARSALPPLRRRLNEQRKGQLGENDLYWTDTLAEAWTLIGKADTTRGETVEAERYLEAAWRLSFSVEAGYGLAELRHRQGRDREAEGLRRTARLLNEGLDGQSKRLSASDQASLDRLRKVSLKGPAFGVLEESVLLLTDSSGSVERVDRQAIGIDTALKRQLEALEAIRLPAPTPDQEPFRVVRRAVLRCSPVAGCALLLQPSWVRSLADNGFQVRIVQLDASETLPLPPGHNITLSATVEYSCRSCIGQLKLIVRAQPRGTVTDVAVTKVSDARSRSVSLTGVYAIPTHATGLDIEAQLLSAQSGQTLGAAKAWLAVREQ